MTPHGTLFSRTKAEGDVISGPVARVTTPDNGWIPMHWGIGFWQRGYNVLPAGDNSIVEACVWAYIRAIAQLPGYHKRNCANGGTEKVTTSALSRLLRARTATRPVRFPGASVRSLLYTGNSYWIAQRNDRQEVEALHWTDPRSCRVREVKVQGQVFSEIFYEIGDNPLINDDEPCRQFAGGAGARRAARQARHPAQSADRRDLAVGAGARARHALGDLQCRRRHSPTT